MAFADHQGLPHPRPDDGDNSGILQNYSMNGKIIISTLGVLFFIVFIIVVLHMYTRWCWRNSHMRRSTLSRLRSSLSSSRRDTEASKTSGLDREIVEALPIFTYVPQLLKRANSGAAPPKAVDCAVCLAEFQQGESCKLLPKCKHFFHVSCIDMWFLSHTTCPLCRAMPALLFVDEEAGGIITVQGQEAQKGLQSLHGGRNGIAHGHEEHDPGDEDTLLHADIPLQPRRWRRSMSDKFPYIAKEADQFPAASVLCWSNHAHVTSHLSAVGGRSFSHIATDILKPTESFVQPSSISSLVSPRGVSAHPGARDSLERGVADSVEKLVSK